jgi:hypothetical protein
MSAATMQPRCASCVPLPIRATPGLNFNLALDYVLAHVWFNLAAASGNKDASENRDIAAARMSPAQIAEAQRLAREWKPK